MKILLVEDDPLVGEAISFALKKQDHAIDWITDGDTAISVLSTEDYALILLDLGLPQKSGLEVLKYLRKHHTTPTIIITARDAVEDKVKGLDAGADDYLVKPFSIDELNARIRAISRRLSGAASNIISLGSLHLNLNSKTAVFDDKEIELTAKEYTLLYELIRHPGVIFSRSQLESKLYSWDNDISSNAIEFIIHKLRKKFSKDIIKNIRGLGWMIPKE